MTKSKPVFPTHYVMFMFNGFRWVVVVCFVDISGIVDHHCLNGLLINTLEGQSCVLGHPYGVEAKEFDTQIV